jgi:hypothetical protein
MTKKMLPIMAPVLKRWSSSISGRGMEMEKGIRLGRLNGRKVPATHASASTKKP